MTANGVPIIGRELRIILPRITHQTLTEYARSQTITAPEAAQQILVRTLSEWLRTRATMIALEAAMIATGIQVDRRAP